MSVTALAPSPGREACALLGEVEALLAAARERLALVASAPTPVRDGLATDADLADLVALTSRVESQAASLKLAGLREAERARCADRAAATGTDAWAAALTGDAREALAGGLLLARKLEQTYHHVRDAYAAGAITSAQARVVVAALDQSPPEATPEQRAQAEELLVGRATGVTTRSGRPTSPRRLRQAARRAYATIDARLAADHEAILLGRRAVHARRETFLALHDNGDGTFSGRFVVPELHGHLFQQALDRLSAPRRLTPDGAGGQREDDSAPTTRNRYELHGAAFCELLEHLPTRGHAPSGVTLLVRVGLEALASGVGAATLDSGGATSAGEARRLACEAGLLPAVLGGASEVLDLGREQRLHSRAQRRALALTFDSCAIVGCERPLAWCETHHPHPWAQGGCTDLCNAVPLCGWHHQRAHDVDWTLVHDPDAAPTEAWRLRRTRPAGLRVPRRE